MDGCSREGVACGSPAPSQELLVRGHRRCDADVGLRDSFGACRPLLDPGESRSLPTLAQWRHVLCFSCTPHVGNEAKLHAAIHPHSFARSLHTSSRWPTC